MYSLVALICIVLSFGEACQFRTSIGCKIKAKFVEANNLKVIGSARFNKYLPTGAPCYRTSTGTSVPEQLVARKLLSVVHAIKKVRV